MSISDAAENSLLKLIFQAVLWANWAVNATSSPEANIVAALHSADPGDAGTMATSEVAYTNYARVNVARTTGGWTVTAASASPVANIDFPLGGAGASPVATHFSLGKSGGGAAEILFSGTVTPNITCGNGVTPRLTTATTIVLD